MAVQTEEEMVSVAVGGIKIQIGTTSKPALKEEIKKLLVQPPIKTIIMEMTAIVAEENGMIKVG